MNKQRMFLQKYLGEKGMQDMAAGCSTLSGWNKWEKGIVVWVIYDYYLKYRKNYSVWLRDREHFLNKHWNSCAVSSCKGLFYRIREINSYFCYLFLLSSIFFRIKTSSFLKVKSATVPVMIKHECGMKSILDFIWSVLQSSCDNTDCRSRAAGSRLVY